MSKGNGSAGRASAGGFNATAEVNAAIDRNLSEADKKARDVGKVMAFVNNSDNGVKVNEYYREAMDILDSLEGQIKRFEKDPSRKGTATERQIDERRDSLNRMLTRTIVNFSKDGEDVIRASGREVEQLTKTTNRASFGQKQMVIDVHEELKDVFKKRDDALKSRFRELRGRLNKIK